jgi:hypothetical protein
MKTWLRILLTSVLAAFATLVTTTNSFAAASCHKINAKGTGQDLGRGDTTARITGGGLLNGTTAGTFTVSGNPPELQIAGTVKFTAHKGSLTVTVTGTFNGGTGDFSAEGPVTDASGKLAGATGTLKLTGNEDLSTGSFVEAVTGRICVELAP